MKPRVYVETSVLSYLTARPSRDVVIAGHQQVTREWWDTCTAKFDLVASELVLDEASAGDDQAARERVEILHTITLLEASEDALKLARDLVTSGPIPQKAAEDALHIAIAVTNGVEYLVTWNYRHIANATMRGQIEALCRSAGYDPPIICTPEELLEGEQHAQ